MRFSEIGKDSVLLKARILLISILVYFVFISNLLAQKNDATKYAVQVVTSFTKMDVNSPLFHGIPKVHEEKLDSCYAYTTELTTDLNKCYETQKSLKKLGFGYATLIVYENNKRYLLDDYNAKKGLADLKKENAIDSIKTPEFNVAADNVDDDASPVFIFIR